MRFSGSRRARGIILVLVALLAVALWRVTRLYAEYAVRSLGPTLIAQLETRLQRKISIDRLVLDRPGSLVAEGVRVSQGKTFDSGVLLRARRLELRYNPVLLAWDTLWNRGVGQDTRARLFVTGLEINRPNPLPVLVPTSRLLSSETLEADFNLGPVLLGVGNPIAGIGRIKLGKPQFAAVHRTDGTWDLATYLTADDTGFRGEIDASEARIDLTDLDPGALPRPQRQQVAGDFTLQFAGAPVMRFRTRGRTLGANAATFEAIGTRDSVTKKWFATVQAATPSMPYWYRYFVKDGDGTEVLAGAAVVNGVVWDDHPAPQSKAEFRLDMDIRGGSARIPKLRTPFQAFEGRISSQPELLTLAGNAGLGGIGLQVSGEVLSGPRGQARWSLASRNVRLAALARVFPDLKLPEGMTSRDPLDFQAVLTGVGEVWSARGEIGTGPLAYRDLRAPAAQVSFQARFGEGIAAELHGGFSVPAVHQKEARLSAVSGAFDWKDNLVQATGAFRGFGGSGRARVSAKLNGAADPELYLTGHIQDVELRQLPWKIEGVDLAGVGGAEFVVSGKPEAPVVSAFVRGTGLAFNGHAVDELAARVRIVDPDAVLIETATIRDRRGQAVLHGRIGKKQDLDLMVAVEGLDIGAFVDAETPVTGSAYFQGHVGGTAKQPVASGEVKVYQPTYGDHAADYAMASVEFKDNDVQLSGVKLIRTPEVVTADAVRLRRAGAEAPWHVEADLRVEGLSAGRAALLARLTPEQLREWPVAGEVRTLNVRAHGPLASPLLAFDGRVTDTTVRGLDLGQLAFSGSYAMDSRRLELTRLEAESRLGVLAASGEITFPSGPKSGLEGAITRFSFRADGLQLGSLIRDYQPEVRDYALIRGAAAVSGSISGPASQPVVALDRVSVRDLVVNGTAVTLAPFTARISGPVAVGRRIEARIGEGRLEIPYVGIAMPAAADARPRVAVGPLAARDVPLAVLLGIAEASPAVTEAQRDWLAALDRWARRSGTVQADVALAGGTQAEPTDAELEARLTGKAPEPAFQGNLRITGLEPAPGLGALAALTARFTSRPGRFDLEEFKITQPGGLAVNAKGRSETRAKDTGLDYTVELAGIDLDLADQVPDRDLRERLQGLQPLDGELSLTARVSGTDRQPVVTVASGDIRNPVVSGIPLDRVEIRDATFTASQNRLNIGSAVLGKRPSPGAPEASLRISGSLPVTWPELSIPGDLKRDLVVELPRQPLAVLNALAADADRLARRLDYDAPAGRERFTHLFGQVLAPEGSIEGRITLAGTANSPNNSGSLSLTSKSVRIRGQGRAARRASSHLPGWLADEIAAGEPLQTVVQDFRLGVNLAGEAVGIELTGKSSHGGSLTGGGEITLGRDVNGGPSALLNLHLTLDRFRISENDGERVLGAGYAGTQLKTTLTSVNPAEPSVGQRIRITGAWPAVMIAGGVRLDDASLPLAFDSPPAENRTPLPQQVALRLAVVPGKDVWLRNQLVRLQLEAPKPAGARSGADSDGGMLVISERLAAPVIQGTLRASHGVFNLPLIRLRNAEGVIRVSYDGRSEALDVPRPGPVYVDLLAETTLRIQRSPAVEAEYYDATFEIRGTPGTGGVSGIRPAGVETGLAIGAEGGLNVTVRTDPPLPSGQIEALIRQQYVAEGFGTGGANVVEALRGQIEQALAVNVASEWTGRVEDLVRSALGLSIFSVDFGLSQPIRVRLGRRLFGPVYGTVSQSFGAAESQVQRRYEVYYRVSPQFRVGYRQEDPLGRKVFFFSGTASF